MATVILWKYRRREGGILYGEMLSMLGNYVKDDWAGVLKNTERVEIEITELISVGVNGIYRRKE